MAQTMVCDGCNEREAVVMITQIGTGEIQAFCPWCAVEWFDTAATVLRQELAPAAQSEPLPDDQADQTESAINGPDTPNGALRAETEAATTGHGSDTADTSTADQANGATMNGDQPAPVPATQEG